MNESTKIFAELQTVLGRIHELNGRIDANQPIAAPNPYDDRVVWSGAQATERARQRENAARRDRVDQIGVEIGRANAEAAALRKRYNDAMEAEARQEFSWREVEAAFQRGVAVVDGPYIAWFSELDARLKAVVDHVAAREPIDRELRKTGAAIDHDILGRLRTSVILQRAIRSAGLARLLDMDTMGGSGSAGDAARALLKSAIRKPQIERGKAA